LRQAKEEKANTRPITVAYVTLEFILWRMKRWSLTLHGPNGVLNQLDSGEAHFVVGSEQGGGVITVSGEGVAARHARVSLNLTGMQVEDLGSGIGTLVNGYLITERV
jgi:hypothetical protein